MEVVGYVGTDVGGEARGIKPSLLRPVRKRRRGAEGVAREDAPDVHLAGCRAVLIVVVVGGVEVPLGAEVVVDTRNAKVACLR